MEKILVVCSSNKSKEILVDICKLSGDYEILSVNDSVSCKEKIKNINFDLVIINSPLRDDYGDKLSNFIIKNTNSDVILIIKNNNKEELYKVEDSGVYVVEKPLNKNMLIKIIKAYIIHRRRYNFIIEKNEKLQNKISDIKLIDRAKLTLIQYLRMSEEEAHKYIEKQSMNLRITRVQVAKNILKIYEF